MCAHQMKIIIAKAERRKKNNLTSSSSSSYSSSSWYSKCRIRGKHFMKGWNNLLHTSSLKMSSKQIIWHIAQIFPIGFSFCFVSLFLSLMILCVAWDALYVLARYDTSHTRFSNHTSNRQRQATVTPHNHIELFWKLTPINAIRFNFFVLFVMWLQIRRDSTKQKCYTWKEWMPISIRNSRCKYGKVVNEFNHFSICFMRTGSKLRRNWDSHHHWELI